MAEAHAGRARGSVRVFWIVGCLLAAVGQVALAGYQLGVGNQAIQIAFLKRAINPLLYPGDAMVNATLRDYPSFFYPLLSLVVRVWDLPAAYFVLHMVTAFGVLAFFFGLVRGMFRTSRTAYAAAAVGVVLLLAGHHHALAGDDLYSTGFTHTWAVFPLAILALMLAYRDRLVAAMAVAGIIFNLHALMAGYLALPLGLLALIDLRERGWKPLVGAGAVFALLALPTVALMALHPQKFDAQWIQLTFLRSADHSFPSSWWVRGDAGVPRFGLLLALAAVSLSWPIGKRVLRTTLVLAGGVAVMCAVGYVFAEVWAVPTVIRSQLFRSTRLLLVVMLAHIAYGVVRGVVAAWPRPTGGGQDARVTVAGVLEGVAAVFTLCVVACPTLTAFLPHALVLVTVAALVSGRLSWMQALVVGAALVVAALAWGRIHFVIPGLSEFSWHEMAVDRVGPFNWMSLSALGGAGVLGLLASVRRMRWAAWGMVGVGVIFFGVACEKLLEASNAPPAEALQRSWYDLQQWAREKTDTDALFLTPTAPGGFRIHSERGVVGEWRDGTQLYFTAAFGPEWWKRMRALLPEMVVSSDGRRMVSRGKPLEELEDKELIALAESYHATHVVLPNNEAGKGHKLNVAWSNRNWLVYYPVPRLPAMGVAATVPAYANDREAYLAQAPFFEQTVWPNIEKNRKSDAAVTIIDTAGRPVVDLKYTARQTQSRFDFGCSLPFFEPVDIAAPSGDFKPPPVVPAELERFLEVFNASMIPYSAKWQYLEPVRGEKHFGELDKYINWCSEHRISTEFHFITGLEPTWVLKLPAEQQRDAVLAHGREVVERYGDKVKYWQVINDWHMVGYATELFAELRKINPNLKLGLSDCARLTSPVKGTMRINDMARGLQQLKALQAKGVKVDYFAPHAHQPYGLWPDAREMYEAFDTWAAAGVKVHITEAFVPVAPYTPPGGEPAVGVPVRLSTLPAASGPASRPKGSIFDNSGGAAAPRPSRVRSSGFGTGSPILGPVRHDIWTRELQAEHFEKFLAVCYSHPAVEMVNLWTLGPVSRMPGEGILDEKYQPYPAFEAIKKLIHEKFSTTSSGELPLDGAIKFRGFQGDYEIVVTLEDGRTVKGRFALEPGAATSLRLRLDRAAGTLVAVR